jgi:serine/threonine protein kinase
MRTDPSLPDLAPRPPSGCTTVQPRQPAHTPTTATSGYPFLQPPAAPDELGRLGNYRVLHLLGKGGMGYVFHAEDLGLCRPVALKVMNPALGMGDAGERFLREARVMASIKHDSLVTVFQVGREGDAVYLAMELLQGENLDDWLKRVPRPDLASIFQVARETAGGLAAIHKHGLIHRDLKPANLWREAPTGRVKILDFGLARSTREDCTITKTGEILGTPCYMSPEQARGEPLDARSDLFSFGCVLYDICTGASPFFADNVTKVLTSLAVHDPAPVHQINPAVPRALSDLIVRLLSKDREDRPRSAGEVLKLLAKIEKGDSRELEPTQRLPEATPAAPPSAPLAETRRIQRERTVRLEAEPDAPERANHWPKIIAAAVVASVIGVATPVIVLVVSRGGLLSTAGQADKGPPKWYLSDLEPVAKENWPWQLPPGGPPDGKGPPPGGKGPPPGGKGPPPGGKGPPPGGKGPPPPSTDVCVRGQDSPHGLFMHPPPSHKGAASITYRLGGQYQTFRGEATLNDGAPPCESAVAFLVYGDGKLLWKSRPMLSQGDGQICAVSVQGVQLLKVEVVCAGEPHGCHAVWVEPFLAK